MKHDSQENVSKDEHIINTLQASPTAYEAKAYFLCGFLWCIVVIMHTKQQGDVFLVSPVTKSQRGNIGALAFC